MHLTLGKKHYRSPEVVSANKPFDAKKNDIHCLGVCLFQMITFGQPWMIASKDDKCFAAIKNGQMAQLLSAWKKDRFVDADLLHLFDGFFQSEDKRISLEQIRNCAWLNKCNAA